MGKLIGYKIYTPGWFHISPRLNSLVRLTVVGVVWVDVTVTTLTTMDKNVICYVMLSCRTHFLILEAKLMILYFHPRNHRETRLTNTVWRPAQGRSWDYSWKDSIQTFLAQRINVDEKQTNIFINRCFPWKKDFICYKLIWNSAECLTQWLNIQGWRWGVN